MRKAIFRADGNTEIGLGHVYRLLALAEMLRTDFYILFAIRDASPFVKELILSFCKELIEIPETVSYDEEADFLSQHFLNGSELVTLDGYNFNTTYQKILRKRARALICIDDFNAFHFVADAVINHSVSINADSYSSETYTRLYLGFDYALLRKPFLDLAKGKTHASVNDNVFISLGGADKNNDILKVLQKCNGKANSKNYHLVIGGAYMYKKELEQFLYASGYNVKLYINLSASEMADLMSICGTGICSPSTVCMEYLCSGGQLFLYKIAENQEDPYQRFLSNGIAQSLDLFGMNSERSTPHEFIDGRSDERIVKIFSSFPDSLI